MKNNVVSFAWEIIHMQQTIENQSREIDRLSKIEGEYNKLLNSSIENGRAMMGNTLKLLMTPGVVESCVAARAGESGHA